MGEVPNDRAGDRDRVEAVEQGGVGSHLVADKEEELHEGSGEETAGAELSGEELAGGVAPGLEGVGQEAGGIVAVVENIVEIGVVGEVSVVEYWVLGLSWGGGGEGVAEGVRV